MIYEPGARLLYYSWGGVTEAIEFSIRYDKPFSRQCAVQTTNEAIVASYKYSADEPRFFRQEPGEWVPFPEEHLDLFPQDLVDFAATYGAQYR